MIDQHRKRRIFRCCRFIFLDVDECTSASQKCHANADCVNTHGSYHCTCKPRYIGDGHSCTGELFKGYCMLLTTVHRETTYI